MGRRTERAAWPSDRRGTHLARLILDTTVLIAAERDERFLETVVADEDDVVIAAVTAAELLVGVALADEKHRANRQAYVEAILASIPVEPYDVEVARSHASLLAHARWTGQPRGAHDLIIAATARAHGRVVVTADSSALEDLPGVEVRVTA